MAKPWGQMTPEEKVATLPSLAALHHAYLGDEFREQVRRDNYSDKDVPDETLDAVTMRVQELLAQQHPEQRARHPAEALSWTRTDAASHTDGAAALFVRDHAWKMELSGQDRGLAGSRKAAERMLEMAVWSRDEGKVCGADPLTT